MASTELLVKVSADLKDFNSKMKKVNSSLKSVGQSMTRVGQRLSVGLTAPLGVAGTASIKLASDRGKP